MSQPQDVTYIVEMMASPLEKSLVQHLHKEPEDQHARQSYGDLLEEQGRLLTAQMVRAGWTPGEFNNFTFKYHNYGSNGTYYSGVGFVGGFTSGAEWSSPPINYQLLSGMVGISHSP